MSQTANDWASPDPRKNIILADADRFSSLLTSTLGIQFLDRYITTTWGGTVSESELRHNQFLSPLPVNLQGHLSAPGAIEINVAEFRESLHQASRSDAPVPEMLRVLGIAMPGANVTGMLMNMPAIQQALRDAAARF